MMASGLFNDADIKSSAIPIEQWQIGTGPAASDHPVNNTVRNPWRWIPTLYFGQGLPYVVVMTLAVVMYKNLGVSNTDIALYTSWLYLPWVIKPLWSPLVDLLGTKRRWIVALQFLVGAALAVVALTLPGRDFFQHDAGRVLADGLCLGHARHRRRRLLHAGLPQQRQAAFVGVRSTFYRLAMIAGQGGLVYLAGLAAPTQLGSAGGGLGARVRRCWPCSSSWLALWHLWALPRPADDRPAARARHTSWPTALAVFAAFFRQPGIVRVLAFLLLYRFAEAQLLKLVTPFMLDPRGRRWPGADDAGRGHRLRHGGRDAL